MERATKVTDQVPAALLERAQAARDDGVTGTIRRGLELVAARDAYDRVRKMRGPSTSDSTSTSGDRRRHEHGVAYLDGDAGPDVEALHEALVAGRVVLPPSCSPSPVVAPDAPRRRASLPQVPVETGDWERAGAPRASIARSRRARSRREHGARPTTGYFTAVRQPGDVVAERYEIEEKLAVGGMGAVYRARHLVSRRPVALKLLHPHLALDEVVVARFRREARAAAEIGHPGVVEVLDAGLEESTGTLFLAMELLEGGSLRDHLVHPETTRGQAFALIDALLEPLAAAHARGFVHRDLKPENVFVEKSGRVKLLDFGIAKDALSPAFATATGVALGTPHYMPPEQIMSSKSATPASDVWAVGAMLYEIAAGRPPFTGATPHAVVVRACVEPHAPLGEVAPEVGPKLTTLVDRALDKDPKKRFADAHELRDALRDAVASDPDASHQPITIRPKPPEAQDATVRSEPSERPASTGGTAWQRIETEHFSISLPPSWAVRSSSVPYVVLLVVDLATEGDEAPTTLRIKKEEWPGDTRSFADLGVEGISRAGRLLRTSDATIGDLPGIEVDALHDRSVPPVRMLHRCAAKDGVGWVVQASADPDRFAQVAPVLRAILGTLRFR